jgi:hypothetical protein
MRTGVLLTGLFLLFLANLLAMYGFSGRMSTEGFTNYFLENAGSLNAKPIGPYDQVRLQTGNNVSQYRYNHPDEEEEGNYPKFNLGPDNLFMFRDNQSKPECCGSSYSSDVGCVCTTPAQRKFLNTRGGNRTVEDGF